MDTLKTLHKIGAFFFFVLGFLYVAMALMLRNAFMPETMFNLIRLLDLPLAFVALLYGGSTLALHINQNRETLSPWTMVIATICVGLLTTLVVIQVTVPGQI